LLAGFVQNISSGDSAMEASQDAEASGKGV
jgi:hypothetical protein